MTAADRIAQIRARRDQAVDVQWALVGQHQMRDAQVDISALLAAVEAVRELCDAAERGRNSSPWVHVNDVWDAIEGVLA